jgi:hypothetical protein
MNSLIGDSRIKLFKVAALTNKLSDNWSTPGAGLLAMEDLVRDVIIMHHGEDQLEGKTHIYISAGICDLTYMLKAPGYKETIFKISTIEDTKTKFANSLNSIQTFTINEGAIPIFTTIYPMSIKDWNQTRLSQGKTKYLKYMDDYPAMQLALEETLVDINRMIVETNVKMGMATPLIHKTLIHNRSKGKTFKYNLLADGCHPSMALKLKIVNSIAVAITKNR